MSFAMSREKTWEALVKRAESRVTEALLHLQRSRRQLAEFRANRERLEVMRDEYRNRLQQAQSKAHAMSDNTVYRNFIARIETLQQQMRESEAIAQKAVSLAEKRHREAEAERVKMEWLQKREHEKVRHEREAREQRRMEEAAIIRFNHR
jgi:flagellar export protein FliJ